MTKLSVFLKSESVRQMLKVEMLEEVSKIIAENSSSVSSHDSKTGDTPLHLASEFVGDVDLVGYLIVSGADVNARSQDGCTALHRAVFAAINAKGNADRFIDVAKFLATKVSDIEARGVPGKARDILAIGLDPKFTKDEIALVKLRKLAEFFDQIPSTKPSGTRGLRIEIPELEEAAIRYF